MEAYLEIVGPRVIVRSLNFYDLRCIGEFTRENVAAQIAVWIEREHLELDFDFHAVCGDIDIPWATEEAKRVFESVGSKFVALGQEVDLYSEVYTCRGTVVKVTPESIEVRATEQSNLTRLGDLLHFDSRGKGRDDEGTHECGAWHLTLVALVPADCLEIAEHSAAQR